MGVSTCNISVAYAAGSFSYSSTSPGWEVTDDGAITPPKGHDGEVNLIFSTGDLDLGGFQIRASDDFQDLSSHYHYGGGVTNASQQDNMLSILFQEGHGDTKTTLYYRLAVMVNGQRQWDEDPKIYNGPDDPELPPSH